jgi:glucan phosphoethanolaminetransferase (alkaline phosphatase superfamily)
LRRLARFRSRYAPLLLVVPAILATSSDLVRRRARLSDWSAADRFYYALAVVESMVVWGVLLLLASRRRGALRWLAAPAFVILGALALGGERYFYDQFDTYLNADAVLFAAAFPASVHGQLGAHVAGVLWALSVPVVYLLTLAVASRKWLRPAYRSSRVATIAAPAVLVLACLTPCSFRTVQAATPDVIWFHAVGGLAKRFVRGSPHHLEPGIRQAPYVPTLSSTAQRRRNVLFILTESVRFDAVCSEPGAECPYTPFTHRALPDRQTLLQMRSNSSTTAVSFGVLLSGLPPTESREAIHTAPLLFDYAHAAGFDTAYWTSQHMMFAHSEAFVHDLPVSYRCGGADLDPKADIDMGADDTLLTARVKKELPLLHEPWFVIVHYSSTHFPYRIEKGDEPFQPASDSKSPSDNAELFNYYRNAVHAQDRTIADLIGTVRASAAGSRAVVVFTSDHGEAFREHGQLAHTSSVLEEEVHVPGWVDAPPGTLTDTERAALASARTEPTWHLDLPPTILDLLGLWSSPQTARFRSKMVGTSLLRRERTHAEVPLTNCTELWGCPFRNWGLMRGTLKLEAREWDFDWHCWDVATDPHEEHDLGRIACGSLASSAEKLLGGLPKSAPEQLSQE